MQKYDYAQCFDIPSAEFGDSKYRVKLKHAKFWNLQKLSIVNCAMSSFDLFSSSGNVALR